MTQLTLTIDEGKKAEDFLRYLDTLDFVKVQFKAKPQNLNSKAVKAAKNMRGFLEKLPNRTTKQSDVNKAVKEIREGNFY